MNNIKNLEQAHAYIAKARDILKSLDLEADEELSDLSLTMMNIRDMIIAEQDFIEETEQYDKQHGSFFDRGSADSYYGRVRDPHRGGVGGMSGPRIDAKDPEEFEAYHAGYDYNEQYGDRKDWG